MMPARNRAKSHPQESQLHGLRRATRREKRKFRRRKHMSVLLGDGGTATESGRRGWRKVPKVQAARHGDCTDAHGATGPEHKNSPEVMKSSGALRPQKPMGRHKPWGPTESPETMGMPEAKPTGRHPP